MCMAMNDVTTVAVSESKSKSPKMKCHPPVVCARSVQFDSHRFRFVEIVVVSLFLSRDTVYCRMNFLALFASHF